MRPVNIIVDSPLPKHVGHAFQVSATYRVHDAQCSPGAYLLLAFDQAAHALDVLGRALEMKSAQSEGRYCRLTQLRHRFSQIGGNPRAPRAPEVQS